MTDLGEKMIADALEELREEIEEDAGIIFGKNKVEVELKISFGGSEGLPRLLAENEDFKFALEELAHKLRELKLSSIKDFADIAVKVTNKRLEDNGK